MSGTKQECAGSAGIKLTAREVEDATEAIGEHSRVNTAAAPARRDCLRASLRIGLLGIDHVLRGRDPGGRPIRPAAAHSLHARDHIDAALVIGNFNCTFLSMNSLRCSALSLTSKPIVIGGHDRLGMASCEITTTPVFR